MPSQDEIRLVEYSTRPLPPGAISESQARLLWQQHPQRVALEVPSAKTQGSWKLSSLGWVGSLPIGDGTVLRLLPKVPLANLFAMLEVAYDLRGFELLTGVVPAASLDDYYERLAHVLARRVRDRLRRGLYRRYVGEQDRLPYLRGRLDLTSSVRRPWSSRLDCHFEEHRSDVDDNRILAWTLDRALRCAPCGRAEVRASLRQALRQLRHHTTLAPCTVADCRGRTYDRLNDDYRPLHALCAFLLSHTGPSHESGDRESLPFLVDMASLFESFVSRWLSQHLPDQLMLRAQPHLAVGDGLAWRPDLVLHRRSDGRPLAVLDCKYKRPVSPASDDVAQVVAYATHLGTDRAFLVYPIDLPRPLDVHVGSVQVRSAGFLLDDDLDAAGHRLLSQLGVAASKERHDVDEELVAVLGNRADELLAEAKVLMDSQAWPEE
jgi:5-methylcytosine-specific restriction enzyme subunit McrC